jgi:hypothetical protein
LTHAAALALYAGSYLVLSRQAFRRADADRTKGFYFCPPRDEAAYRLHRIGVVVYYPLIALDNLLGTGRPPGKEPLWQLQAAK